MDAIFFIKNAILAQLDRALVYGTKGQGFESLTVRQIRTQNRIQEIVPNLRFLLPFRGIFTPLSVKFILCDKKSLSSEVVCAPADGLFFVSVKIMGIR